MPYKKRNSQDFRLPLTLKFANKKS